MTINEAVNIKQPIWINIAGIQIVRYIIEYFPDKECLSSVEGVEYKGTASVTLDGTVCVPWTEVAKHIPLNPAHFPDGHFNINSSCRNLDGRRRKPWCYTNVRGVDWGYCDIPLCGK